MQAWLESLITVDDDSARAVAKSSSTSVARRAQNKGWLSIAVESGNGTGGAVPQNRPLSAFGRWCPR